MEAFIELSLKRSNMLSNGVHNARNHRFFFDAGHHRSQHCFLQADGAAIQCNDSISCLGFLTSKPGTGEQSL